MRNGDEIETRNAGEIRAQAGVFPAAQIEETPDARLAQVGVNEHGAVAKLRERDGKIGRRGRLAFARQGAGDQNDLRRMIGAAKEAERGAQRAERFGHLRFGQMLGDELDALLVTVRGDTCQRAVCLRASPLEPANCGNDGQRRQARKRLDVVGRLHGVVHVFAQKGQTDAADQTDEKGESDVASFRGTRGIGGNHRWIDDANVGRLQRRGNAGFLELGQQAVVESFVGLGVALEDVVFHHALGHLVGFDLLLIERLGEQDFALLASW